MPAKPSNGLQLWWRKDSRCTAGGYWCATFDGRKRGFGSDYEQAKAELVAALNGEDLPATPQTPQRATVADVYAEYVDHQHTRVNDREIKPREFEDTRRFLDHFAAAVGAETPAQAIGPQQFSEFYRQQLSGSFGPDQIQRRTYAIRRAFEYAAELELIPHVPNFGPQFKPLKAKALATVKARTPKLVDRTPYKPRDVRRLIRAAPQPIKSMILLAINCAFGNTDCGLLGLDQLHLKVERDADGKIVKARGYHSFPRPKNPLLQRRCPLWPETVRSLVKWLAIREKMAAPTKRRPRSLIKEADKDLVFITRHGNRFVRENVPRDEEGRIQTVSTWSPIGNEFEKVCAALGLPGGFYRLRHTAITWLDDVAGGDVNAVHRIRGHSLAGMSRVYVHQVEGRRLVEVVRALRRKLWLRDAVL